MHSAVTRVRVRLLCPRGCCKIQERELALRSPLPPVYPQASPIGTGAGTATAVAGSATPAVAADTPSAAGATLSQPSASPAPSTIAVPQSTPQRRAAAAA